MPTTLPRIQVTQTAPLDEALALAEELWPGVPRSEQVARLAAEGARYIRGERERRRLARRDALLHLRDTFAYPAGYRDELREDWPE